jgi:hypothetical protein
MSATRLMPSRSRPELPAAAEAVQYDEQRRRDRREFIRTHHPDLGGDPAAFMAGLAAFDEPAAPRPVRVVIVAGKPWPESLVSALLRRIGRKRRPPRVN